MITNVINMYIYCIYIIIYIFANSLHWRNWRDIEGNGKLCSPFSLFSGLQVTQMLLTCPNQRLWPTSHAWWPFYREETDIIQCVIYSSGLTSHYDPRGALSACRESKWACLSSGKGFTSPKLIPYSFFLSFLSTHTHKHIHTHTRDFTLISIVFILS